MPEQDKEKREAPISYRPPKELRAEFDQRVRASGLSRCAFLNKCVFGRDPPRRSRRPSIEHAAVAQIIATMAQIRDELRALNTHFEEGGDRDALAVEKALDPLIEIRSLCFKALGRKP